MSGYGVFDGKPILRYNPYGDCAVKSTTMNLDIAILQKGQTAANLLIAPGKMPKITTQAGGQRSVSPQTIVCLDFDDFWDTVSGVERGVRAVVTWINEARLLELNRSYAHPFEANSHPLIVPCLTVLGPTVDDTATMAINLDQRLRITEAGAIYTEKPR